MNKQAKQMLVLGVLLIVWAISWRLTRIPTPPPSVIKTTAAKSAQQDSLLKMRFHKVRAQMDGLYHYRIKPAPFDAKANPFRIPAAMAQAAAAKEDAASPVKSTAVDVIAPVEGPPESGEILLKHAIDALQMGGVVTMNTTTLLNVNGDLHKQGDVFTSTVKGKLVLLRIKRLTTNFVVLALDDPSAGNAEARVRLGQ
jgi:hypothetical protein